jgi:hypothetical protein
MIPYLDPKAPLPPLYREFLEQLAARGFSGEIQTDYATRLVAATDNSVYPLSARVRGRQRHRRHHAA